MNFTKEHLAKNTIPAAYINYIMRHHAEAVNERELSDYTDYDKTLQTKRRKGENSKLGAYQ
jgi:hypothetical protein